ncbi:MAG: LuxR C-terminal-related transcriptional regulator [Rubrivivax sp.]
MQHWTLVPTAGSTALGRVIGGVGAPDFAAAALRGLNGAGLHAASWSVYQVWRERPPVLHLSASLGVADTTRSCFRAYEDGLYRADRSFDAVAPGTQGLLRMHADEVPSADHRDAIYRRHGVVERLSVAERGGDASLFAVNFYRHAHQGRFDDADLAALATAAPLLLAAVRRHVALQHPASPRQRLQAQCAELTERELDVCERLLRGWSYDGIAADMGLSIATVKTYRARAFVRLGMHFKSELFASFGTAQ